MTRKDYEAIARVIRDTYNGCVVSNEEAVCRRIAEGLARVLSADNARFDPARFIRACGMVY